MRLNSPLTSHRESPCEEGGDDVARQGSEHVEGPPSDPEDTRYSHFCFHSRYVGSLGLRKEPNIPNQYDSVSLFFKQKQTLLRCNWHTINLSLF